MKRKTKLAIAGAVVVIVGYALYKYLTPQGTTPEADEPSPETGGETDSGGGFISNIVEDVFGLTNDDEAELTDTPTPDLTGTTGGSSGGTTPPPPPPPAPASCQTLSGATEAALEAGQHTTINCVGQYTEVWGDGSYTNSFPLTLNSNHCGAKVAALQNLINRNFGNDVGCIPVTDYGQATQQTRSAWTWIQQNAMQS